MHMCVCMYTFMWASTHACATVGAYDGDKGRRQALPQLTSTVVSETGLLLSVSPAPLPASASRMPSIS